LAQEQSRRLGTGGEGNEEGNEEVKRRVVGGGRRRAEKALTSFGSTDLSIVSTCRFV
jgi:hypothetical protein